MNYNTGKPHKHVGLQAIHDAETTSHLNWLCAHIFENNVKRGWYSNPETGERIERNVPEMLCLIHSEISEGMEGYRKNLMDTHLIDRPMLEVEMADAFIRICDLAGYLNLDLGGAVCEKLKYNAVRVDHTLEVRAKGGKKF